MEINQLAFVLEAIDSSIHDTPLLAAYERLIAALAQVAAGEHEALPEVSAAREAWIAEQRMLEPINWSAEQLDMLDTYGARAVLGDVAIGRMIDAFVSNFMDAKAVLNSAEALLAETTAVTTQVTQLLAGLDPILMQEPKAVGELVEVGDQRLFNASNGLIDTLRDRLNLPMRRDTALMPAQPSVPLATKVAAATPIILAAAGKALEIYRAYSDMKATTPAMPEPHPIRTQPQQTVNNFVRYTYKQTTVFIQNEK